MPNPDDLQPTQQDRQPADDEIRTEAYFLSQKDGNPPNNELNYWLQAKQKRYDELNPSRGYGATSNWGGKYLYGAFSSLVASYVVGMEFHDKLNILNNWNENEESRLAADNLIKEIEERYTTMTPGEVREVVRLSQSNEIGDIFRSRLNNVTTAQQNLDFMENVMADYHEIQGSGVNTSRMDMHGPEGAQRLTLEPVSRRWEREDAKSFEAELHRGAYAIPFGIPQNSLVAYYAGYLAGDRAFETDILDTKDRVAVVNHEFALNQQTGEPYAPARMISDMTAEEVGQFRYGVIDPDLPFPNARDSGFNIRDLSNIAEFFDRYLPEASLSLDARNMSSVTSIMTLNEHYSASERAAEKSVLSSAAPARKLATSVKVYPFLLAHGYDHALMEFVARTREGAGIGFEELKFWMPPGHEPEKVPEEYRTDAERRIVELKGSASNEPKDVKDRAAISRAAAIAPPTDIEREAFKKALRDSPLVLSIGGVLMGGPSPGSATADKDIYTQFTKEDLDLARAHQGSNSVLSISNLTLEGEGAIWRDRLPFGRSGDPSEAEKELVKSHNVPRLNDVEKHYVMLNTLKLFQYVASFVPNINPTSSVQFEAKPSLMEIMQETKSVNMLTEKQQEMGLSEEYKQLNSLEKSTISNRLTLLDSAVIDNTRELIRLVGEGEIPVETYSNGHRGGNQEEVEATFKQMRYAAFDRHSDFTLEGDSLVEGVKAKVSDYVYFVVQGRMDQQKKGPANQTGQLHHTPYWISRSTTDLPVEFKQIYHHAALHGVDGSPLPYPEHVTNSRRSILTRPHSEEEPQPRGITWGSWQGSMPSKEHQEAKLKDALTASGHGSLGPYMQGAGQAERIAQKRQTVVEKVRKARM